jgi:hypothetical protein
MEIDRETAKAMDDAAAEIGELIDTMAGDALGNLIPKEKGQPG